MGFTNARNPSLWVGTTSAPRLGSLEGDTTADAVIVGAGITGLTTAVLLAGEGLSVTVLESGEVCAGATGYTTAKVTSLHSTIYSRLEKTWGAEVPAVYAAANQAGIATIRSLVATNGIDCGLEDASAFTYTETADQLDLIRAEVEAASRAGLPASFTTSTDLPFEVAGAVRLDGQAQFHPRRYCLGLLEALQSSGGRVFEQTRALKVHDGRVVTDRGVVTGEVVVLACHVPFTLTRLHAARMEPMRSYAIAFRGGAPRPRGMYISVDEPTRSIRSTSEGWIVIGGEGHKVGHDQDTRRRYEALEAWARERFSAEAIDYRWSAQDYQSADGLPFVGRLSRGTEEVYVATGFGKWGMANGTAAAMIIGDLIRGRDNPWAKTFDSTRIALRQEVGGAVRANVDVVKHLIGDRLISKGKPEAESLPPGWGAVASSGGTTVAAFRDDGGDLHVLSATCTHLGCRISYNTAERTWDCPCHGSRFDIDGKVIQGPAVKDLAPHRG